MKRILLISICLTAFLPCVPVSAATLGVTASATPNNGVFNYAYMFSVTGTGGIDTLFLGSDDLSPLNLVLSVNGTATSNWSWLGNDVPQNYLEFFSTSGSMLMAGDSLGVRFSSSF